MTCTGCGTRRAARYISYSHHTTEAAAVYPVLSLVEYHGDEMMIVWGIATGREYAFSPTRRLLFMDVRDLEGLSDEFSY